MKYLVVQYTEGAKPLNIFSFDGLPAVTSFLQEPENAFGGWCIYEIAREVPYTALVNIDIEGAQA